MVAVVETTRQQPLAYRPGEYTDPVCRRQTTDECLKQYVEVFSEVLRQEWNAEQSL